MTLNLIPLNIQALNSKLFSIELCSCWNIQQVYIYSRPYNSRELLRRFRFLRIVSSVMLLGAVSTVH